MTPMQAIHRVKEVSLWLLVLVLAAAAGCVTQDVEDAEPGDELAEVQQKVDVRTGNGQTVSCSSSVVLDANGNLASCTTMANTTIFTAIGQSITFNAGTRLVLYTNGSPTRGTLWTNTSIRTGASGTFITFNAGTTALFHSSGVIDQGVLWTHTGIRSGSGATYTCNAGTSAGLYATGNLRTCVMLMNTNVPTGSGTINCNAGLRLTLSTSGLYQSCN